ncbi:PAS domain-containing protein [Paracraurococcus lichenis]|uniref:histidine kinase n=1 Tax=Paracraurococcus lichenis TaxID=3064888 RepID=A0ABT9E6Z5_9PROT|nr:PAS domain-containing protein [Paracraurococcus sp. LOR1-02]MDO9711951.1 PAS domain-containing protein [Paracraurococcus sp. LOR1-02]
MPDIDCIRGFAQGSPMAVLVLQGPSQRIRYLNPAFLAVAGRPETALLDRPLAEAFPALTAAQRSALERVRLTGEPCRAAAIPLPAPADPTRLWDVELSAVQGSNGQVAGVLALLRDVTAERSTLREAEAARATLDALFRHIPEGLILAEAPDVRLTRVSEHALQLVDRAAEEVLDQVAALHPDTWQVFRADGVTPARPEELPLTRAVQRGETVQHETWVLRRRDGRPVPILCSAGPIREEGGPVLGGILCFRDITDLQVAEAALAVQEARYRGLVEAGALAVWITSPEGELLDSASWSALTGQAEAAASGLGWLEAIHPRDRAMVRDRWMAAMASGEPYEVEYRLQTPAGGWRWTAARAVPRRDARGRIAEWIGTNTDIEARKQAEQGLRASEDRFRTLAEAMPHLVWQTDAAGAPEYLNQRWLAVTGLDLAAVAERGWMAALHPEDVAGLRAGWEEAVATGGEYDADARIHTVGGAYRWHRVKTAPVRDAFGHVRHWVGTCTDVEERHQAEDALREALAAQERLVREADHRIKNSLQLVAALLRLQSGRVPEPAAREALEAATLRVQAVAEAHRALQMSPDLRSVRLTDMLRELAAGATVQHPGADIRIEAPEGLALDAERAIPLALILSELVADVLRQEPSDGPGPQVRLEARLEAGRLAVSVTDGATPAATGGTAGRLGETVIRALARQIGAELVREAGRPAVLRLGLEGG